MRARTPQLIGIVTALLICACAREPEPRRAQYTVNDYLAKPELLTARLHKCSNNPGELRDDPDCVNVKEAVKRQGIGSYDKLPPLKLSKPGPSADSDKQPEKSR